MGSERRDRFLKLERARPGRPDAAEPPPGDERFEGIGDPPGVDPAPGTVPAPPPRSSVPSSSTDRFRPPPERPLETMEEREGAQPFTRCASCQMDNTIYAAACLNCGAALDTPAQRAFNERFWAERQAQAETERREMAEREKVRQGAAADQARQQRELGEEIARRERERVDADFPDGPFQRPGPDTTGMRLLRLLPGTGLRIAAAVVIIGLPLLLLLFGRGMPQLAGMVLLGIVVALFSPSRRRTRRW
ncbi:MAG: hypothetical protein WCS72_07865 [Deltaproteobacteria bacterium]